MNPSRLLPERESRLSWSSQTRKAPAALFYGIVTSSQQRRLIGSRINGQNRKQHLLGWCGIDHLLRKVEDPFLNVPLLSLLFGWYSIIQSNHVTSDLLDLLSSPFDSNPRGMLVSPVSSSKAAWLMRHCRSGRESGRKY